MPSRPIAVDNNITWLGDGLHAGVVVVTPEIADAWLGNNNGKNRKISKARVHEYAVDIADGKWQLNGEPIIFDADWCLRNGQHRLSAVVEAGASARMLVVTGVPATDMVMATLDTGMKRSSAQALGLLGETDTANLAAMALTAIRVEQRLPSGTRASISAINEYVAAYPQLREYCASVRASKTAFRRCNHTVLGAMHFLFARVDKELADDFMDHTFNGHGLEDGDPVLALRNAIFRLGAGSAGLRANVTTALTIKAWNATYEGRTVKLLKWLPDEDMPRVAGLRSAAE